MDTYSVIIDPTAESMSGHEARMVVVQAASPLEAADAALGQALDETGDEWNPIMVLRGDQKHLVIRY